ncbi:MAG: peptidyl-prolyl cis-trans isomerase [Candidatus Omnitrophota bacterium]|nr:peptidyl-prolyl cis-trans isomerase [Candidatus Omnitrophota bacterium]
MVNLKFKLRCVMCLCLAFSLIFSINSFAAEDKILCVVGDDLITQKDLNEFLALAALSLSDQYSNKNDLDKEMEEIKKDALNQLIEEKLIIHEAKRQKLTVNEKQVQARIEEISSQFPAPQGFEKALVLDGLTLNEVKRKIKEQLLMREAIEENVRSKVFVHPQEVTNYYNNHSAEFDEPEKANVDSIFISTENSLSEAQKKVREVENLLRKGEDFPSVASQSSEAPSLGIVMRGQLKREIEEAIFNLKIGEFSKPIRTEKGFFVFKLLEIIPPQKRPLSAVQNEVYRSVYSQKFQARYNDWLKTIKKDVYCLIK